eukprot:Blabericola_migrator_1__13000@NODE_868_length_6212_cov_72_802929_g614_i0_p1_GENE_NODE_868_length_6212_cov_72_802929_g614_i0NODE_868_length_6212_cov_72_802929_g614_i0_p1_ORF_typecomplete_len614_score69_36_NODE_868_length_6212_cov_72_802929_g614_i016923533
MPSPTINVTQASIGTARTSPFALIEVAFLTITVALICSHKSEISDGALFSGALDVKLVLMDMVHAIATGLSIFFATVACSAALHREVQYISGCIVSWRSVGKSTSPQSSQRLPGAAGSVRLSLLLYLGLNTALILLVLNMLVPFLTLKVSRLSHVQSASTWVSDELSSLFEQKWKFTHMDKWSVRHFLELLPLSLELWVRQMYSQIEKTVFSFLSPDACRYIASHIITFAKGTWKVLMLIHLQGTKLFPWKPYTYEWGESLLEWLQSAAVSLVTPMPKYVLMPWLLFGSVGLLFMSRVFARETSAIRQTIGGAKLTLLASTLAASHVTSLLIYDVVRLAASLWGAGSHQEWDTSSAISKIMETREAAEYFRAFQKTTALGITLTILCVNSGVKPPSASSEPPSPLRAQTSIFDEEETHAFESLQPEVPEAFVSTVCRRAAKSDPMPVWLEEDDLGSENRPCEQRAPSVASVDSSEIESRDGSMGTKQLSSESLTMSQDIRLDNESRFTSDDSDEEIADSLHLSHPNSPECGPDAEKPTHRTTSRSGMGTADAMHMDSYVCHPYRSTLQPEMSCPTDSTPQSSGSALLKARQPRLSQIPLVPVSDQKKRLRVPR